MFREEPKTNQGATMAGNRQKRKGGRGSPARLCYMNQTHSGGRSRTINLPHSLGQPSIVSVSYQAALYTCHQKYIEGGR